MSAICGEGNFFIRNKKADTNFTNSENHFQFVLIREIRVKDREENLHVANLHALFQRRDFVFAFGNEFLRDESFEAGFDNRFHHGRIKNFL